MRQGYLYLLLSFPPTFFSSFTSSFSFHSLTFFHCSTRHPPQDQDLISLNCARHFVFCFFLLVSVKTIFTDIYNIFHKNNIFLAAHNSYRLNLFLHCYVMWRKLACVLSLSKYQHHSKIIQLSSQYCLHTFDFYLCTKCSPLHGFLSEKPHQKRRNMTTSTRSEASSLAHHLSGQPPGLSGGPCPAQGSFGLG